MKPRSLQLTSRMKLTRLLFMLASLIFFFAASANTTALLATDEVEALKEIAATLGKENWNFSVDPCSGQNGWNNSVDQDAVACDCSFTNSTICHVTSIVLKRQNLPGSVPTELVKLPYLQQIDLTLNYLNGTMPPEWGALPLVNISLFGNRVTGLIPKEIGNISTLGSLVLQFNQLSGVLPPELGNLSNIKRLYLSSNNFSGELPETLGKLTTLQEFWIADNNFTGTIPAFIQNWTNLTRLVIQGTGLAGPIPSGISRLKNLVDLRISDLNGDVESDFPTLSNMTSLEILILKGCNIVGKLPDLGDISKLTNLDLSFNNLTGEIPSSYSSLATTNFMYLTGNMLDGTVPDWIQNKPDNFDISYNNFTNGSSTSDCQNNGLFGLGGSLNGNNLGAVPCLKMSECTNSFDSFHINCGSTKTLYIDGDEYEADGNAGSASAFYESGSTKWAFSSVGDFIDDGVSVDNYTATNSSVLTMSNSELYTTARLSPLSLTYYGICMVNGSYTVSLHFSEIMFTDDETSSSLGTRVFDVYIQGEPVLKNFNIKDEAGGAGKVVIKKFNVMVTSNALEIRLYWASRGTQRIPANTATSVYGPLISAISVEKIGKSLSGGVIAGIVVASVFFVSVVLVVLWWKGCLGPKDTMDEDLKGLDIHTGSFTLRQLKAATNNFDPENKIGEGGFGPVYKGHLLDGTIIAVKQLSSKSKQGNREFVNEIGMISAVQHPHLVKLHGCCIESNQLLLVYEYMENNSLANSLFEQSQLKLDWSTRRMICIGIAKGMAYLHEESRLKIVHRDIKATNILLDGNLNPKISDFGLAKLDDEGNTHMSTRIAGTFGYMAPEYAMHGYLTDKADVYSFGILALEIVSGRKNTAYRGKDDYFYLLDLAMGLKVEGKLLELVDPMLESKFNQKEAITMINVALQCTNISPAGRPPMSSVVSMLEGKANVPDMIMGSGASTGTVRFEAMYENGPKESITQSLISVDQSSISTSSMPSLYASDSEYWRDRV